MCICVESETLDDDQQQQADKIKLNLGSEPNICCFLCILQTGFLFFVLDISSGLSGLARSFPRISISLTNPSDICIYKQMEAAAVTSRIGVVSGINPFVFVQLPALDRAQRNREIADLFKIQKLGA